MTWLNDLFIQGFLPIRLRNLNASVSRDCWLTYFPWPRILFAMVNSMAIQFDKSFIWLSWNHYVWRHTYCALSMDPKTLELMGRCLTPARKHFQAPVPFVKCLTYLMPWEMQVIKRLPSTEGALTLFSSNIWPRTRLHTLLRKAESMHTVTGLKADDVLTPGWEDLLLGGKQSWSNSRSLNTFWNAVWMSLAKRNASLPHQ